MERIGAALDRYNAAMPEVSGYRVDYLVFWTAAASAVAAHLYFVGLLG